MGGRARHYLGRAARPSGAGAGGDGGGGRRASLHIARRRPAPSPPRADQRTRLRTRCVAWTALGWRRRQHRGAQRDWSRRGDVRPPSSGPRSRAADTGSTTTARSSSSRRTPAGSASAPPRSIATSTGTRPHGEPSTPTRSPGRDCAVPGTDARGRTHDPTRSCPRVAPTSAPRGTTNCATSASRHRPAARQSRVFRSACRSVGSIATSPPTWCSPDSVHGGRRGTQPTSAVRPNDSSPPSGSSPNQRPDTSWSRTSRTVPGHGACRCWIEVRSRSTSAV